MNLNNFKKMIEDLGTTLEPDDDWMPALLLENAWIPEKCEERGKVVVGLAGDFMSNSESKDMAADIIAKMIAKCDPDSACFISTAWSVTFKDDKTHDVEMDMWKAGLTKLSEHKERIEVVVCVCAGQKGEMDGESMMMGIVGRSKDKHPTIKKWKVMSEGDSPAEGRFIEAIREGFARTKRRDNNEGRKA